ncbi:hypothetical protein Bca52824_054976 [Brassica carinata]|uniref:Uncharacterized protein n=1 Tax=Brassica carinata TaxID=52824 RepID=A0A8X7UN74_BRACI|nr:hypothetical protein Bca52824_054976 [Brassica carinata]
MVLSPSRRHQGFCSSSKSETDVKLIYNIMANSSILLTDLKDRRCSSSVDVRLLGFLEARNVKLGGELKALRCFSS